MFKGTCLCVRACARVCVCVRVVAISSLEKELKGKRSHPEGGACMEACCAVTWIEDTSKGFDIGNVE